MIIEIINFIFFFVGGAIIAEVIFLLEKYIKPLHKVKKTFSRLLPDSNKLRCAILGLFGGVMGWFISSGDSFAELFSIEVIVFTLLFGIIIFVIIEKEKTINSKHYDE